MKKTLMIIGIVFVVLIVVFCSVGFYISLPKDAGSFSVENYADMIDNSNFKTDKTYGEIKDYKTAAKIGKQAIADRFEDSREIFMKYPVQYDSVSDSWYIHAEDVFAMTGGAYGVIIKSNGTVLAIWGEK